MQCVLVRQLEYSFIIGEPTNNEPDRSFSLLFSSFFYQWPSATARVLRVKSIVLRCCCGTQRWLDGSPAKRNRGRERKKIRIYIYKRRKRREERENDPVEQELNGGDHDPSRRAHISSYDADAFKLTALTISPHDYDYVLYVQYLSSLLSALRVCRGRRESIFLLGWRWPAARRPSTPTNRNE